MTETNDSRVTGSKKNLFHLPQRRLCYMRQQFLKIHPTGPRFLFAEFIIRRCEILNLLFSFIYIEPPIYVIENKLLII